MKIRPRQQLLEVWRSLLAASWSDGRWRWADPTGNDSVVDAQQLLCLVFPPVDIESLRFSNPDATYEDVLSALQPLGGAIQIPRVVLDIQIQYLERHRDDEGPRFDGAGYLVLSDGATVTPETADRDIAEGFALSVTLTLAMLAFAREFRRVVNRGEVLDSVRRLEELASERLTAALVGLVRSFAVDSFEYDSKEGTTLLQMLNQTGASRRSVANELRRRLQTVTASVRDLRLGIEEPGDLDNPNRLYQVGWSWGVVEGVGPIEFIAEKSWQRPGDSYPAPYLYFTVVVMDGLADLFSPRTRQLGLLDDVQQRLAQALQLRWELTQRYWSTLGSFGEGRWPLEDLPWRTVDTVEHDYYSLLVTAIIVRDLANRQIPEQDTARLAEVLRELGNRARITRRALSGDPAVESHISGILVGMDRAKLSEAENRLRWTTADFAPLLLKRTVRLLQVVENQGLRRTMMEYLDELWDHLERRKLGPQAGQSLWDEPVRAYPGWTHTRGVPAWQPTLRVVESLVQAAQLTASSPVRNPGLVSQARAMLDEAEHLYDQELLRRGVQVAPAIREMLDSVQGQLNRVREIIQVRPASAVALLTLALHELDSQDSARAGGEE
ncbi:hypothetical protein LX16_4571 [Stackebrandtia albiflava]|uniref:Uncharacterized protein n=1 Tax=Stackebrandtia albiflava TaxID=406432 RepID=A0A562URU5_9ACTN|nr:SCO2524 family protein [Stackebrandtia albiflava]TWJ08343.1 hypothetical protein LX16_4571 [Stackebrandtia albiflava]